MTESKALNLATEYHFHGYRLDVPGHCLYGPDNREIPLSNRALDTLRILIEHRGETLSKAHLMEQVWPGMFVEENNLNQAITSIRKALGDSKTNSAFIRTVTGRGYCFVAEFDGPSGEELPDNVGNYPGFQQSQDAGGTRVLVTMALGAVLAVSAVSLAVIFLDSKSPDPSVALVADDDTGLPVPDSSLVNTTDSFEAYRYNLAAIQAYDNQDFEGSLKLAKQALALDPEYRGALYNFARSHYYLSATPLEGMTTTDHLKRGLESADRLIELDPDDYHGFVLKAMALGSIQRWDEAMQIINRLPDLNTPLSDQLLVVPVLMSLGEHERTVEILEATLKANPINSNARGFLMAAYEATGNHVQARLEYDLGEELKQDWWGNTVQFLLTLGRGEDFSDIRMLKRVSPEIQSLLHHVDADNLPSAYSQLEAALHNQNLGSPRLVHYAAVAAALGRQDLAIAFMQRATSILPVHLHWIWQPVFRETWQHPDFVKLLDSTGVLAYWKENGPPGICQSLPSDIYFVCDPEMKQVSIRN